MVYKISFHFSFGGGIEGKIYSNSLEAWNLSYDNGNRIFDADLMFTTDGKIVLRHENSDNLELNDTIISKSKFKITDTGCLEIIIDNYPMSYADFMDSKIYSKYTPMSLEDMIDFMFEHKDLYVAVDSKDDVTTTYKYLKEKAYERNKADILDRIIVSVYNQKTYDEIRAIYNFKNYTIRQYVNEPHNFYELAEFCIKNSIHTINISKKYINNDEINILKEKGIHVYVAIADYISDMKYYKNKGASGVITNWLYESDWNL